MLFPAFFGFLDREVGAKGSGAEYERIRLVRLVEWGMDSVMVVQII